MKDDDLKGVKSSRDLIDGNCEKLHRMTHEVSPNDVPTLHLYQLHKADAYYTKIHEDPQTLHNYIMDQYIF